MLVFVSALEVSLRVRSCWLPTILLAKTTLFDAHKLRKPATEPNTAVPEILHSAAGARGTGVYVPPFPLPQFLAGHLTLYQPGGGQIIPTKFSDLPKALRHYFYTAQ